MRYRTPKFEEPVTHETQLLIPSRTYHAEDPTHHRKSSGSETRPFKDEIIAPAGKREEVRHVQPGVRNLKFLNF